MEIIPIDEIIEHCNRQLDRIRSGTITYQEHESVRHYLQILKHYIKLELPFAKLRDLAEAKKKRRVIITPCAIGETVYVLEKCKNISTVLDGSWETATGYYCPYELMDKCPHKDATDCSDCEDKIAIFEDSVQSVFIGEGEAIVVFENTGSVRFDEFGEKVFLSHEDADKKIKEMQNAILQSEA